MGLQKIEGACGIREKHIIIVLILSLLWGSSSSFCFGTSKKIRRAEVLFRSSYYCTNTRTRLCARDKKHLSASERERKDEEARRRQRKDDVVIGKSSAKKNAKDFALDPKSTEEQFLRQASKIEQEIFQLTEIGLACINSLELEEADDAFDRVFKLKPNAYLWQAGIVKFYLGDIDGAGKIFASAAEISESRFGIPATEERIWRDACELKYLNTVPKELKEELHGRISAIIPTISEMNIPDDSIFGEEPRKVYRLARDLFSSTVALNKGSELLARAKLRSIGGADKSPTMDPKMWKLSSWFFLGLYYDVVGNPEESKKCMKMGLRLSPSSGKSENIVHTLPLLHMSARDWFDDDEFDAEIIFNDELESENETFAYKIPNEAVASMAFADPLIEKSIREGVTKMKLKELKDALKLRGKRTTGSKEELQERIFYSLMDDAGFASPYN